MSAPPTGVDVVHELSRCGVRYVVTVPDWVQMPLHLAIEAQSPGKIQQLKCCTEDEAFMIAGGLHIGGERSAIVIQNQGLYAGLNALRGIGLDAGLPLVMLIGQFGREPANLDVSPRESNRRIVRMLEPLLVMLEIPFWTIDRSDQIGVVSDAYESATTRQSPAAVIFGRNLSWSRS